MRIMPQNERHLDFVVAVKFAENVRVVINSHKQNNTFIYQETLLEVYT